MSQGDDIPTAASPHSKAPDGGEADVGTTPAPSAAETESVYAWALDDADEPLVDSPWPSRLRWTGLVTLLCATIAAVVWFAMTFYFQDWSKTPRPASPSSMPSSPHRSTEPSPITRINNNCNASTVPLVKLNKQAPEEPTLALPQPPGWIFDTELHSQLIRAAMVDPALEANDFSPNVAVTLENVTGRVSTPQQALDAEVAGVVEMLATSIDTRTPGTVCGYPSTTITYTIYNNYAATGLIIAAQDSRNRIWAATVDMKTTQPDNPDYINAKRAILNSFQFSLPQGHVP